MDSAVEARFERIERLLTQAAELAVGDQNAFVQLAKHSEALQNTVIDSDFERQAPRIKLAAHNPFGLVLSGVG
jgi:hypothetical protein